MYEESYEEILSLLYQNKNDGNEGDIKIAFEYFNELTRYTVYGGKQNRAKAVINTFRHLNKFPTDLQLKQANVLGCCIEILQAGFLVHDDIMDKSLLRRNKKCWYLVGEEKGLGLIAVNDGLHLNSVVMKLLKEYFRHETFYSDLTDLYNDVIYRTCCGQCLDMLTSTKVIDWSKFSESRYKEIALWKTAYYSFYLPVASGMILAGITDEGLFKRAEKILLKMGIFFQIQDDYLDCFGDAVEMGKVGRDIEDGKCSWLVVQALKIVNDEQLEQLKQHYGKEDPVSVAVIKHIYSELKLDEIYSQYEAKEYDDINTMIDEMIGTETIIGDGTFCQLLPSVFTDFVKMIFKRRK